MVPERPWVTPVGLAVVGLVIAANAAGAVGLGVSGDALVVTVGVAAYIACAVPFLLWSDAPEPVTMGLLVGMSGAAALTHHGDPASSGGVGLYLGMAFAPLRLELRRAAAVCVLGVLVFDLQLLVEAPNARVFVLVVTGGAAFFFLLGLLLRREGEQRAQVTQLLADLEASREAEKAAAALAERSRLAREMHDVLAHTLSGLVLQLDGLRLLAGADGRDRARGPDDPGADVELRRGLERAHRLARTGLQESRQTLVALRGEAVPGPELLPTLVEEHRGVTGQRCQLVVQGAPRPLPPNARLTLYRTAQEALSNVRKHAPAAEVTIELRWDPDAVRLEVQDTGQPVAMGATPRDSGGSGYGLTGMAERAQLLGGTLLACPTEEGFRVLLTLPAREEST